MKKLLYSLAMLLAMSLAIVSCEKENSDVILSHVRTPELDAEGVYTGTWIRTIQGTVDTATATGSITIKADTSYLAKISFKCTDLSLDQTASANISFADKGFVYYNNSLYNEMATPFFGHIDGDSINTASFELKVRVGRKFQYCTFRFEGPKTN